MDGDGGIVEAGRAYDARAWNRAYDLYAAAPHLDAGDLDRFAVTAMMLARMDEYFAIRERAFHQLLGEGDLVGAATAALWAGMQYTVMGESAAGGGWLARAARLVEEDGTDSVPAAFLVVGRTFELMRTGDLDGAAALTEEAIAAGRRLGSADLTGLALHHAGLLLLAAGRTAEGLAKLDEAMVELGSGSLSPMVTGIVYCGAITGCWSVYELIRAEQWTAAMTKWCESQPELGNFTGECLVHRAELKLLRGTWPEARTDLGRVDPTDTWSTGRAAYVAGTVDRLEGRWEDAEARFAEAGRLGCDPQPGLALLRLARGGEQAAAAMLRRCLAESQETAKRVEVLVAAGEVFLATGDVAAAADAVAELDELAGVCRSATVDAFASQSRAALLVAQDRPDSALAPARAALRHWIETRAPYDEARTRLLIADACRRLGDQESALAEDEAARAGFRALGAVEPGSRGSDLLSAREVEVLRLVATGATNRAIAAQLVLSERTVDRHVSNILNKLGVASRAGATSYAHTHGLV